MNARMNFDAHHKPADAKIVLPQSDTEIDCQVFRLSRDSVLVMENVVKDLPDRFFLALAPDFTPRACSVAWRRGTMMRVLMFA